MRQVLQDALLSHAADTVKRAEAIKRELDRQLKHQDRDELKEFSLQINISCTRLAECLAAIKPLSDQERPASWRRFFLAHDQYLAVIRQVRGVLDMAPRRSETPHPTGLLPPRSNQCEQGDDARIYRTARAHRH